MREKLIELIAKFCGGLAINDVTPPYGYENLADHLIANGVTVRERGRWEKTEYSGFVRCSCCKDVYINEEWLTDGKWNGCPNCFADLRGEEDG